MNISVSTHQYQLQLVLIVIVAVLSACQAVPASRSQWSTPVVRAAPAFDGDLFVPTVQNPVREANAGFGGNTIQNSNNSPEGGIYSFAYDVQGEDGGHSHQESRDSKGTVTGRYTIALADGRRRVVEYIADEKGFRARVDTNEPGTNNRAPASVEWNSTVTQPPVVIQPSGGRQAPNHQKQASAPTDPPKPSTHISARPAFAGSQVAVIPIAVIPDAMDEPRTPHHPPRGFEPPTPESRIHLAPPRPINVPWGSPVAFSMAPWGSYLNGYPSDIVNIQAPYPIVKKK
ncbi:hypothetical protein BIW11_08486 [Tropilaelaps mercedesae]|uniref:Cuticle protein 10.9-like n=1 Tax=Tropilaelaps mercedesae TaxID=418985 RepID=A0A1V9XPC5_9ACAR|nr:hypothetical protein BIW11_08486 [Tropilaelaps mercedesae]